jgi:hypothetical protein
MSESYAGIAPDPEFDDRCTEIRVIVRILGRFSLASKRDADGNRHEFACRAVNIRQRT